MKYRRIYSIFFVILTFFLILPISACWDTGELIEETLVIDLESADKVFVTTAIYKGNIHISGGNQTPLLISDFSYNLIQWAPKITYTVENGEGNLKIIQKENEKGLLNPLVNDWFLKFKEAIPLELDIMMGSGENQLDLSSINLMNLKVVIGTGDTTIDLTGNYRENINVYLIGGIGHTIISIPEDIGIRLFIKGGLNRINCDGLNQIGNFYYNSGFDFAERKIYITLFSGLGMIDIKLIPSE